MVFVCAAAACAARAGGSGLPSAALRRPVFPAEGKLGIHESRVAPLLAMSEQEMLALVPELNGILFCGCPNCDGGTQDQQMEWCGLRNPERVRCKFCGMEFPNEQFPLNKSIEAVNRRGKTVTWRYYEDPKTGAHHYFAARARYAAKHDLAARTLNFAAAYALSGNEDYARRAALLLHRFAEVFAGWCVVHDYPAPGRQYPVSNAQPPYPYWSGIWNRWHLYDTPTDLARAYDLIYVSGAVEALGQEIGVDVKRIVEADLFRANIEFQRTFTGESVPYNMVAPQRSAGFILVGRVIHEPDFVHDGRQRLWNFCAQEFYFDGVHRFGTVCYHLQMIANARRAADVLKGYSDPPGYTWPGDGTRLDDADIAAALPMLAKAGDVPDLFVFPNRRVVPVHDSWALRPFPHAARAAEPCLLPAYGHGRLACGSGSEVMQAHLHFSGGNAHAHLDNLSIILFANGQEILSDIGYTHTQWRFWAGRTASHNTVIVDERNHTSGDRGGDLQLFTARGPVQAIEATQLESYPDLVSEFRRRLVLVQVSDTEAYVIDVFRIAGGTRHDYFLHGHCEADQSAECSLPLNPIPGTLLGPEAVYRLPERENDLGEAPHGTLLSYAMFRDLQGTSTDAAFHITWRFRADIASGLRSHIVGQPGTHVILARTPQIRPAQKWPGPEDETKLDQFWRPSIVLRRQGAVAGLASVFAVVHEPFSTQPFVHSVRSLLDVRADDASAPIGLAVEHSGGTDYVVSCPAGQRVSVEIERGQHLSGEGRILLLRVRDGKPVMAYLFDGTELSLGDFSLACPPALSGRIEAVERNTGTDTYAFRVDAPIAIGPELDGRTVLVTHGDGSTHGYRIRAVENHTRTSRIVLAEDPGFEINDGQTRFPFFPQREMSGENRFRIPREMSFVLE